MPSEQAESHFVRFLDQRGEAPAVLEKAIMNSYGTPLLAVATGSVAFGFGNSLSDVDIYVVVDREDLSPLPVPYNTDNLHVDVRYFSRSTVERWPSLIADTFGPSSPAPSREVYSSARFALENAIRFLGGWAVIEDESILTAIRGDDDYAEVTHRFWLLEAAKQRWVSELATAGNRPELVRHSLIESTISGLEAQAAKAGEPYFGSKWLGEKLVRLGWNERLELLGQLVAAGTGDAYEAVSDVEGLVRSPGFESGLGDQHPAAIALFGPADLRSYELLGRRAVSRWNSRMRWVSPSAAAATLAPSESAWSGPSGSFPSPGLRSLVVDDFLWVSAGWSNAPADDSVSAPTGHVDQHEDLDRVDDPRPVESRDRVAARSSDPQLIQAPSVATESIQAEVLMLGHGLVRYLLMGDGFAEDIAGGIDSGQPWLSLLAARKLAADAASLCSMTHGGSLQWSLDDATRDPFRRCPPAVMSQAAAVIERAVAHTSGEPGEPLLVAVDELLAAVRTELALPNDLPTLRQPNGMFQSIALARGLLAAADELGLPSIIPTMWLDPGGGSSRVSGGGGGK